MVYVPLESTDATALASRKVPWESAIRPAQYRLRNCDYGTSRGNRHGSHTYASIRRKTCEAICVHESRSEKTSCSGERPYQR